MRCVARFRNDDTLQFVYIPLSKIMLNAAPAYHHPIPNVPITSSPTSTPIRCNTPTSALPAASVLVSVGDGGLVTFAAVAFLDNISPESENGWSQRKYGLSAYVGSFSLRNAAYLPSGSPYSDPMSATFGKSSPAASNLGGIVIAKLHASWMRDPLWVV